MFFITNILSIHIVERKYTMKNLIIVVFCLVISGFASSASAQGRHHDGIEQFGHEFVNTLVFGERHHRHYRDYPPQHRGEYSDFDHARREGFREARERDRRDQMRAERRAYERALEDARRQGERDYQRRQYNRW